MRILMIASENDGIRDCKVGGIGDVVRDVPRALAEKGHEIVVITPSYGFLQSSDSAKIRQSPFPLANARIEIFEISPRISNSRIQHLVVHHPKVVSKDRKIYCHDPDERPFATDAGKFAHFCRAVAMAVQYGAFGTIDCIHLHDWHSAFFLVLRKFHQDFQSLQRFRIAFTIHNLALQGVRPLRGDESSLESWYPDLSVDWKNLKSNPDVRNVLTDPRWPECINPMAVGIRLADAVHAVSPSYAREIVQPSDKSSGFFGGEGLEIDLRGKGEKLSGILNGCEYPTDRVAPTMSRRDLLNLLRFHAAKQLSPHFISYLRLSDTKPVRREPKVLLTSVTRIGSQKLLLMKETGSQGKTGIEAILDELGNRGMYVLLGSGTHDLEVFFHSISARYDNFVFLNFYSDDVAQALYANGDLFLMPSSFEPCGISQMLAMRDGQPCLVHQVGGLKDTVKDGINGFTFGGVNLKEQVDGLISTCARAIEMKLNDPKNWTRIQKNARSARFLWANSVEEYLSKLYA